MRNYSINVNMRLQQKNEMQHSAFLFSFCYLIKMLKVEWWLLWVPKLKLKTHQVFTARKNYPMHFYSSKIKANGKSFVKGHWANVNDNRFSIRMFRLKPIKYNAFSFICLEKFSHSTCFFSTSLSFKIYIYRQTESFWHMQLNSLTCLMDLWIA